MQLVERRSTSVGLVEDAASALQLHLPLRPASFGEPNLDTARGSNVQMRRALQFFAEVSRGEARATWRTLRPAGYGRCSSVFCGRRSGVEQSALSLWRCACMARSSNTRQGCSVGSSTLPEFACAVVTVAAFAIVLTALTCSLLVFTTALSLLAERRFIGRTSCETSWGSLFLSVRFYKLARLS